jgi:GT2 family glycosyltransferase
MDQKQPRVAINIVTWNSCRFLKEALDSIFAQTYRDFLVLVIDNASTDGSPEFIRQNYPQAIVLQNSRNLGFTRAHNQGFTYARTHLNPSGGDALVLVTNPDIIMEPDYLEKAVAEIDRRPSAGSVVGRVQRAQERHEDDLRQVVKTDTIDTTGLQPFKSGRVADRGSDCADCQDRFRSPEAVFGVSGCLALYRLAALEDARYQDGTVYDEDFGSYKEDVDLAWRLQLLGWTAAYTPDALAYHFRAAAGGEKPTWLQVIRGRRGRSSLVKRLSARNHWLLLYKNIQWGNLIRWWPRILGYELLKSLYTMVLEPRVFLAGLSVWSQLPAAAKKRREIMKRARVRAADLRRWFK